jgi:hypothetical protein
MKNGWRGEVDELEGREGEDEEVGGSGGRDNML